MIQIYDVGSLPFQGEWATFLRGAQVTPFLEALHPAKYGKDKAYFETRVMESFLDKVKMGIDVPNYPQFRDMNVMFLNAISGIEKTDEGYVVVDSPSITRDKLLIPEVHVLRDRSRHIREVLGKPVRIKICVTGPYTLSTLFAPGRQGLFTLLGDAIAQMVEHNIFSTKFGGVVLVTVDEPVFGFLDDPALDYGAEGREELLAAWERLFDHVKAKGCQSCIHLHNTSNELFWQIRSVDILESHVDDPFYATPRTRRLLEKEDKVLKASIAVTAFDSLIRNSLPTGEPMTEAELSQQVADAWTAIRKETQNPFDFLESVQTMRGRLKTLLRRFGELRIPYAGPECGLRSFPTYFVALECLRRVARAVEDINQGAAG